ncbi:MAG: hypothetical protein WC349_02195 [Patescibacteria group bacterium]
MTVKVVDRKNEGNIHKDHFIYGGWKDEDEKKEFVQYLRLGYYAQMNHDELRKLEPKEGDSEIVKAVIAGKTYDERVLQQGRSEYLYFFKAKWDKLPSFKK